MREPDITYGKLHVGIPAVSVVMPAYNVEAFLEEAVESLLRQTFTDFEIVIVDDGSTDATSDIAHRLADLHPGRIRVGHMPANSGSVYQPRKRAVEMALAPVVAPFDADDVVPSDYLQRLVDRMHATDADIVYPAMWRLCGDERTPLLPLPDFDADRVYAGRDLVVHTLERWSFGAGGGVLRKDLYTRCFGRYDSSLTYNFADEVLTRQLLFEAGRVAFSDVPYLYRVNPESVSRRRSVRLFDSQRNRVDVARFVAGVYPEGDPTVIAARRSLFHGVFEGLRLYNDMKSSGELDRKSAREAMALIRYAASSVDMAGLRGHVSPRYMLLFRCGLAAARAVMRLESRIHRNKR